MPSFYYSAIFCLVYICTNAFWVGEAVFLVTQDSFYLHANLNGCNV